MSTQLFRLMENCGLHFGRDQDGNQFVYYPKGHSRWEEGRDIVPADYDLAARHPDRFEPAPEGAFSRGVSINTAVEWASG